MTPGLPVGRGPGKSGPHTSLRGEPSPLLGEVAEPMLPGKASKRVTRVPVPQTDTGGRVENTKAIERTVAKELGKLPP